MENAYKSSLVVNNMLFTSGQISIDENGVFAGEGDIEAQTVQALGNVLKELKKHNFELSHLVKMEIHLQNIERDFEKMNEVYKTIMNGHAPVRVTVGSKLFKPEFLIEVVAMAVK